LDVGAVEDVDEVLPYGGKPLLVKQWERDMNLRDAIKASNVAIYQELARRIGLERMRGGVKKLGYGNMEIGTVVDRFWLDGPLTISAIEQTEFLTRLVNGDLSVSSSLIHTVKQIIPKEETRYYTVRGKTGWAFDAKPQIGWWVGWVEREKKIYPFALNIDMSSDKDAFKRIPLGKDCLRTLGKL
jgi:beta-lactamase class D